MKSVFLLLSAFLLLGAGFAAADEADIARHPVCPLCGMNRAEFAHSRMVIVFENGGETGTCSIHCTAVELVNRLDQAPVSFAVGDYSTRTLIDAEKAFWVIGGDRPGVMSARAKWAFAGRQDAEAFVKAHGGTIVGFEEALQAAFADLYHDTKMIRDRRKAKK
ncbi:MAG: nitrous oxide reductase accessory protein NosL [Desulfobacterales bacterium]